MLHVSVKGRIEIVPVTKRYTLMIDYAHNAMALESLLTTLKGRVGGGGRLVCLFGCGGNRAKSRRYEMGEVSSKLADLTVVTSDNPRNEEPMDIINDILVGGTQSRWRICDDTGPERSHQVLHGTCRGWRYHRHLQEKGTKITRRSRV